MALLKMYLEANEIKSDMSVVINRQKNADAVGDQDTSEEDYVEEPEPVEEVPEEEEAEGAMGARLDVAAAIAAAKQARDDEDSVRHEFEETGTNLLKPKEGDPSMSLEMTNIQEQ